MVRIRTKPSETLIMPGENFLRTLRSLAECYQAFETYSGSHVRSLGLTPAQFDIVATLGNTPGMTCRELGEKTLITKGTLTGVLDRLEARGTIRRGPSDADRRQIYISLTPAGARLFAKVFPEHAAHVKKAFAMLTSDELDQAGKLLQRLRDALRDAHSTMSAA